MAEQPKPAAPARASQPVRRDSAAQQVDQRVSDWARSVLGEVPTRFEAPGRVAAESRCIGLYLMALGPAGATRGSKAPPLQFSLRYLVTAWGPDASASHDDLCELAFAALDTPDFDVDFEPLGADAWLAFGTAPRPAFSMRLPLRKARIHVAAPPVRAPLVLAPSVMAPLRGHVLGPGDVSIAGARVELTTLGLSTMTDHEGRFRFSGVPADRALRLRVLARGAVQEFQTEADLRGPLQLRMSFS